MKITKWSIPTMLLTGAVAAPAIVVSNTTQSTPMKSQSTAASALLNAKTQLTSLRADKNAPAYNFAFLNAPRLDADLIKIEYFTTPGFSLEDAKVNFWWSSTLPQVVSSNPAERVLYARATFRADLNVSDEARYFDLTQTSQIQFSKVSLASFLSTPYHTALLHELKLIGETFQNPGERLVLNEPELPQGLSLRYLIAPNQPLLTKAELMKDLNYRASYKAGDFDNIRAVLIQDNNLYAEGGLISYRVDASDVLFEKITWSEAFANMRNLLLPMRIVLQESTHDNLKYAGVPTPLPYIKSVEYISTENPSISDANTTGKWSTALPTELPLKEKSRHLYARVTVKPLDHLQPFELVNLVDLTRSSGITYVKINFAKTEEFANFSFNKLQLVGDLSGSTPVVDIQVLNYAPQGSTLTYQIDGGDWLTGTQMINELKSIGKRLSPRLLETFKAKLKVVYLNTFAPAEFEGKIDVSALKLAAQTEDF